MLWLILSAICFSFIVFCFYKIGKVNDEEIWFGGIAVTLILLAISLTVSGCIIYSGVNSYSDLVGQKEEIFSLQNRLDDVKDAYYKNKNKATFISGDIANIKQSTALTDYITKIAKEESYYNKYLKKCEVNMQMTLYWWFSDGAFIFDEVKELEFIR